MGLFSMFGKKDKEQDREPAPAPHGRAQELPEGHEGGVAEGGVETRSQEIVAPPGPPDIPGDISTPAPSGGAPKPAGSESPFQPPEAWNTDALTAPLPEPSGDKPQVGATDPAKTAEFQPLVVDALKTVYDPEIPVDIYELGLVYGIDVDADAQVLVKMTLTSPACPSAQQIPQEARYKIKAIPGVKDAWVEIVWDPPWDKDRMSEAAKLQLGFF